MEPNNINNEPISPAQLNLMRKQLCHDYSLIMMQSDCHDDEVTAFLASIRNKWVQQEWKLQNYDINFELYTENIRLLFKLVLKMIGHIIDHVDSFIEILQDAPTRPGSPA